MEDNKAAPSAPPQGGGASRRPLGVLVVFHLVRISYVFNHFPDPSGPPRPPQPPMEITAPVGPGRPPTVIQAPTVHLFLRKLDIVEES